MITHSERNGCHRCSQWPCVCVMRDSFGENVHACRTEINFAEILGLKNPSPEGRGCREAAGEGYRSKLYFIWNPSPGASHHPLPSGEGFVLKHFQKWQIYQLRWFR